MPKHVVLGREHEHHHKDPWHHFEGLVVVLVACHAVAFLFWAWLLYKTRRAAGGAGGVRSAKGGGKGAASSPRDKARKGTAAFEWRTPREILAQQKAKMGKV